MLAMNNYYQLHNTLLTEKACFILVKLPANLAQQRKCFLSKYWERREKAKAAIVIVLVFVPSPYAWHSHLLPPVLFVALERLDLVSVERCKWFVKQSSCLASCTMLCIYWIKRDVLFTNCFNQFCEVVLYLYLVTQIPMHKLLDEFSWTPGSLAIIKMWHCWSKCGVYI